MLGLFRTRKLRISRFTVKRQKLAHFAVRPLPWRKNTISKADSNDWRSHCRFPVVRLFSYKGGFFQILDRPFDGTAGQRQICGYGLDFRPRFAFLVLPIMKIDIHQLCPIHAADCLSLLVGKQKAVLIIKTGEISLFSFSADSGAAATVAYEQ